MSDFSFTEDFGIVSLEQDRVTAKEIRKEDKKFIPFGLPFIDDLSKGLAYNDLVMVSGDTGIGKTTAAILMAESMANRGKRILYLALEMGVGEFAMRTEYKNTMKVLLTKEPELRNSYFDEEMFENNELAAYQEKYKELIEKEFKNMNKNIDIKYRTQRTPIKEIIKIIVSQISKYDAFFIDHLGYIDVTSTDKYKEQEDIMNELKLFTDVNKKPIIAIAHIKKIDTKNKTPIPNKPDIKGAKSLIDIATKVLMFAPDYSTEINDYKFPTYVRFIKYRKGGSKTRYVGRISFDIKTNSYDDNYDILKMNKDETDVKPLEKDPQWSTQNKNRVVYSGVVQ